MTDLASAPAGAPPQSRPRRLIRVSIWIIGVAVLWVVLGLLGVDVLGWLSDLWDQIAQIWDTNPWYIVSALVFQSGQTVLAGVSYYGILKAAYGREAQLWPIVTAYAVGVAMNGFLPANIGTFVTLFMFVSIIPSCTLAGAIAAYLVQKIFFTLAGTFVYLYMFLSVPGAFDISFGNLKAYPILTFSLIGGGIVVILIAVRALKRRLSKVWENAKDGGAILATPKRYLTHAFLPSLASWLCKLAVTGIFLGAFAIPVTFQSIMWVVGSGSLANVASFTPGSVGVTQATNALALKTCCDVPNDVAIDSSTAQQLIVTAWNQLLAAALLLWVFGWTGGKQLVTVSYADAKTKVAESKEERRQKKEAKRAARRGEREGSEG
jgi:glycosyltransferase 2 family protein